MENKHRNENPANTEASGGGIWFPRMQNLEPLHPSDALDWYLIDKQSQYRSATLKAHKSRLTPFLKWCDESGVDNLNLLTGRALQRYRAWRRSTSNICKVTEKTQQDTLRVFLRWCESIDGVTPDLSDKVLSPSLAKREDARDTIVPHELTQKILRQLEQYYYASTEHVVWLLLAETGMRTGTLHGLDLGDIHDEESNPHLRVHHRPGETDQKNGAEGERYVFLTEDCTRTLRDYIDAIREDVTDEYDRRPLLTTKHGRISKTTIRKYVYKWTRPCILAEGCPHDRSSADCEAAMRDDLACKCPSSLSPHPIRRGYITHALESDVPAWAIAERCSVSPSVLMTYYDRRSPEGKMGQRKELFEAANQEVPKYGG